MHDGLRMLDWLVSPHAYGYIFRVDKETHNSDTY